MNARIETIFDVFLAYLQTLPGGGFLVTAAATGIPILMLCAVWAFALYARGWLNYALATADEKAQMQEGNAAFTINQIIVAISLAVAMGPALGATGLTMFWRKVAIALIIQVIAMIVMRVFLFQAHHTMMLRRSWIAAVRLGGLTFAVSIMTMFGMLR